MPDNATHPARRQEDPAVLSKERPQDLGAGHLTEAEVEQVALMIRAELALKVPPPEVIKGYLDFYPDAAKKFFQWAEDESEHRRALDNKLAESQIADSRRGIT